MHDIGVYEVWMYLGLFFVFFGIAGCLQAISARYNALAPQQQMHALTHVYLIILGLSTVVATLLICFENLVVVSFLRLDEVPHYRIAVLFLLLHFSASLTPFVLLVKGLSRLFLPLCMGYLLIHVAAISVPVLLWTSLEKMMIALVIFGLLEHFVLCWLLRTRQSFTFDRSFVLAFLRSAIPLTVYLGIGYLAQIFDAWLITWHYQDLTVFAIYRYGARELPGALALAGSFVPAVLVILTSDRDRGLTRLKTGSQHFMHIFFPLAIVLTLCSHDLFTWVYNDAFGYSSFVFNTYLLLMISRWLFPHAILISSGDNRLLIVISVLELLLNIVISVTLLPILGLIGVALGSAMAFLCEKVFLVAYVRKRHHIPIKDYIPVRSLVSYSLLLILAYCASLYWYQYSIL